MSKGSCKSTKVKFGNIYFTFNHQSKLKKFVFYFESADEY